MSKYIEEKELREWVQNWFETNRYYHPYSKSNDIPIPELYDILERMPTADAVEVVRCKDCKHKYYDSDQIICQKLYCCDGDNFVPSDDDFCSYGERKCNED